MFPFGAGVVCAGGIAVLGIGTGIGFATPIPSDLKEHEPYGTVSNILGGVYFFAWSISFWPQVRWLSKGEREREIVCVCVD